MSEKDRISKINYLPVILALIALAFLGFWQKEQVVNLISDSFIGQIITPEEAQSDLQTITDEQAIFATDTVPIRERTQIKITYEEPKKPVYVTLNLQMDEEGNSKNFIIKDKVLDNLAWSYLENSEYSLFQKTIKYNNIKDFLDTTETKVLVDESARNQFPQYAENPIFSDIENIEDYDYILTNYHQSYSQDDRKVWEIVTNTNDAFLDNNKIYWRLFMLGVNQDNPIKLKIDINYSQPVQVNN